MQNWGYTKKLSTKIREIGEVWVRFWSQSDSTPERGNVGDHWSPSSKPIKSKRIQVRGAVIVILLCVLFKLQWDVGNWMHALWILSYSCFLEIFQKPPGGHLKPLGGLCYFVVFLGSRDGTAWRHHFIRQARLGDLPSFLGFWLELPGDDDQPPGDANLFLLFGIFGCMGWLLFGRKANHILKEWFRYLNVGIITKLNGTVVDILGLIMQDYSSSHCVNW